MSYLVLARKYRPQTFSEVVGQEHITRTLANAFAQERVHHAFLFCGPRGVGKTTAARILGKALNCVKGPTADPCGECQNCESITNGSAVDYFEMDGASNRGIDSIRDLREAVRYQPAVFRKKVYVIDEVHMLTTEAFNALLKTLEEPPPHVTFVLATTEPHKIPNTILSRCQRYDFKLVPSARLIEHIETIYKAESLGYEAAAIGLIVRESGGSVRDALSLADQVISFVGDEKITEARVAEVLGVADRALTRALVGALSGGDAKTALETVDAAVARGVDEVQIARAIVRCVRDLAVLQAAPGADYLVDGSAEERADLAAQAKQIDRARVTQMYERMLRACDDLAVTQMPRLALELALIDIAGSEPVVPIGVLVDRLEGMERRIGKAPPRGSAGAAVKPQTPAPQPPATSAPPPAPAPATSAPPPAPAPAPAPTPAPTDILAQWESVITDLEAAGNMTIVAAAQQARILRWTEDNLVIALPEGSLEASIAADRDSVSTVQKILAKRYGRPIRFEVTLFSGDDPGGETQKSLVEVDAERTATERAEREAEARDHPMTKVVLDTFGAEIKEIKTDG